MKPGDLVPCWGGDFGHYAVVLSTSRHKGTESEAAAEAELVAVFADEGLQVDSFDVGFWRSHTRKYLDVYGCECQSETGDAYPEWCSDGDGKAWVRIMQATVSERGEP